MGFALILLEYLWLLLYVLSKEVITLSLLLLSWYTIIFEFICEFREALSRCALLECRDSRLFAFDANKAPELLIADCLLHCFTWGKRAHRLCPS